MATSFLDISSDDDCYINAADRLKALKKKLDDAVNTVSDSDSIIFNPATPEGVISFTDEDISFESQQQNAPAARSNRRTKNRKSPVADPSSELQQQNAPTVRSYRRTRNRKSPVRITNLDLQLQNAPNTRSTRRTRSQTTIVVGECTDVDRLIFPTTRSTRTTRRTRNRKSPDKEEPPVTSTICLMDSDSDELIIEDCKDNAEDEADQNYEISVKVNWRSSKLMRIPLRKFQAFTEVFEYFATLEGVPQRRIWLMHRDKRQVHPTDTPDSLGLTIVDILEGGLVDMEVEHKQEQDKDSVNIKVQMKDRKEKLNLFMKRNQKFRALVSMCSEQLSISEDKIKLFFDGEPVNLSETPETLDLDGGECFDMHTST